jgi:hypothetical protein
MFHPKKEIESSRVLNKREDEMCRIVIIIMTVVTVIIMLVPYRHL